MPTRMDDDQARTASALRPVEEQRSLADNVRLGGGIALVAALVLFFAQNFGEQQISFLWFNWDIPLVFALLLSAAVGSLATWLFTTFRGRAERKRQEALFDSAIRDARR